MKDKKLAVLVIVIIGLSLMGLYRWQSSQTDPASITNFEECVAAGYPVMESYPEQCAVPGGPTFTRVIDNQIQKGLNY